MILLKDKADCCGCTACTSICPQNAIEMVEDSEGFLYPKVNYSNCINCGLCDKICPIKERTQSEQKSEVIKYYAARIKNRDVWMASSSGGIFSAISEYALNSGGVVYGAIYNKEMEVIHSSVETIIDLNKIRGSKYVQSKTYHIYEKVLEHLKSGRIVVFSGTPCQVEALKLYLRKDYANLLTVDIVCHAVPSPRIFKEYVSYVNNVFHDKLIDLNMRYKGGRGWGHHFSFLYKFTSGKELVDPVEIKDWARLYFSHMITRPSCHECKFCNYNRSGDVTLADYWDDHKRHPEIYSKNGTSLLLINTEKGLEFLNGFIDKIEYWPITKEDSIQPCLTKPVKISKYRGYFWNYYYRKGFERTYSHFFEDSWFNIKLRIKGFIVNCIKNCFFHGQ